MRAAFTKMCVGVAILMLGACAFSPQVIHNDSRSDLAYWYFVNHGPREKAELVARNDIPADEWPLIDANKVAIGMGPDAVVAAWGQPSAVNTTTTAEGDDVQWVYAGCSSCANSYVYFVNNLVSTIQN